MTDRVLTPEEARQMFDAVDDAELARADRAERRAKQDTTTAPCDDCGKAVRVPDDWPVDWAYCPACQARNDATNQDTTEEGTS